MTDLKRKKQKEKIKEYLGCKLIRKNPNAEDYIFIEIGKIHNYTIESTTKLTEKATKK